MSRTGETKPLAPEEQARGAEFVAAANNEVQRKVRAVMVDEFGVSAATRATRHAAINLLVGRNIRRARVERKRADGKAWTQTDLARALGDGADQSWVSRLENGPTGRGFGLNCLHDIAKALGVTLGTLLEGVDEI